MTLYFEKTAVRLLLLVSALIAFTNAQATNIDPAAAHPDWKNSSSVEIAEAIERFLNDDSETIESPTEALISEIRRRVELHGPNEPKYLNLLVKALAAKVYIKRESHFAHRAQMQDEVSKFEASLPEYQEANRILSTALERYPNDISLLRSAIYSSFPITDDFNLSFKLLSRLVSLDKTDFVAHYTLVKNAILIDKPTTARLEAIQMLKKMLALSEAKLFLVPFDETAGNLPGTFRDAGLHCAELSTALATDFTLLPEQFRTTPERAQRPDDFKNPEDRNQQLTALRKMIRKMIADLSASSCGSSSKKQS